MRDYYVRFPALPLSRREVMERLQPVFQHEGVLLADSDCEELARLPGLQRYGWTGRTASFRGGEEALRQAEAWQGVSINFQYVIEDVMGSLSLLLWNDQRPDRTTVALCEASVLFTLQREHPAAWARSRRLFLEMGNALGASFCQLECEPDLVTLAPSEVAEALEHIAMGRHVPYLLAVRSKLLPAPLPLPPASGDLLVLGEQGYTVVADARMGVPDDEDG